MRLEAGTVTVPPLDVVKMEDRKRPSGPDDSAPPAKRQAVTVNGAKSHQDADLPWKDDIENYQKDAIMRQMREYKREKSILEAQLSEMEKRTMFHDDHLRTIDVWFSQLIDEIKVLANDSLSVPESGNGVSFPSTLLFEDNETFSQHLSARSEKIKSALAGLFARIPTASAEVTEVQKQMSALLASEKEHIAKLHQVTTEKEQLADRFDMATHRYMVAEKKMDRLKSAQVQKLEMQAIASSTVKEEAASSSANNGAAISDVNGVTGGMPSDELETARKEAIAETAKRREQIQQLEAENKKLTDQVTSLQIKLAGLSDDDYAKTDLFKVLKSQHEDVIKRINHLEATNVQLREEAQKLQAERTQYRIQVDEESRHMISETESQLAQSEANLARIRNNRDEYLAKLQMLEATQKDYEASKEQLKDLASARESRIAALELESERLRLRLAEQGSAADRPSDLSDLTPEQLRDKIATLEANEKIYNDEMASMTAAFKKAQATANKKVAEVVRWEEQVARANADKAKADQKFFAAMKTKEAREVEVRVLREKANKSTELVTQLKEQDSLSRSLVDKVERQIADMRAQMEELSVQHRVLQQRINEGQITMEGQANQITELKKALATKDTAYTAASHAQREAEAEQEKLKERLQGVEKQVEVWKKKSLSNQSEEASQMRSMLQCQVCKNAFKNTVIKTCGHVFCDECVNERIVSRSRKCPNCSKAFGNNDTMRIHI